MPKHDFEVFPFDAYDGFNCNLWRLKNDGLMPQGPVLLVHGAGVRSNIFNAPNDKNLIDALAEAGIMLPKVRQVFPFLFQLIVVEMGLHLLFHQG